MKYAVSIFAFLVSLIMCGCGYARLLYLPGEVSRIHPALSIDKTKKPATNWYRAGVARAYITPRHDSWLAGFQPYRKAVGVHDNLEVRTLVLIDLHGNCIALVTADLIGFMYNDVEQLRIEVKIPNIKVFVMSSHTHAGPDTIGIWGAPPFFSGRDERYVKEIIDVMAKTIFEAINNARPVNVLVGSTRVPDLSKNIRESKFLDTELSVLLFIDVHAQKPYALIINFGCHPEVLKSGNRLITADMVGVVREHLDTRLGIVTLFVNGALGGMVQPNMKWNNYETFEKNTDWGKRLVVYVDEALRGTHKLDVIPFYTTGTKINIPLHNKRFWLAALFGLMPHRGVLTALGRVVTEVNVLKIGDTKIVMIPGEIVPELALNIKALGGSWTQVWSLANDEIGYILNKEKFYTKIFKYERTMSVGPEAGPLVVDAAKNLLEKMNSEAKH